MTVLIYPSRTAGRRGGVSGPGEGHFRAAWDIMITLDGAFSHRRMSLKTGVGAFCVAGAPFWFFGFDLGTGESSSELWECGNRGAISKGGGKRGKPGFGFPRFPPPRHFHNPLPAVQHGVLAGVKLANSLCLACCIRRAAAVSLSAWAMRPRASSVCPGLR